MQIAWATACCPVVLHCVAGCFAIGTSRAIAKLPQVGFDGGVKAGGFVFLLAPLGGEACHFFGEGFAVALLLGGADVAAGGEDVAVFADFFFAGAFAKAGDVGVVAGGIDAAPGVVGAGDALDVVVGEFAAGALDKLPHATRVDEEGLPAAVCGFEARKQPEAGGDLGGVEELPGKGDHAGDGVGFDHEGADVAFARLGAAHGAVGEDDARRSGGREVVPDVLQPGEVGVAGRRDAKAPARVLLQALAAPVGDVEGRVGEDGVGLEVGERVLVEAAFAVPADVAVDAAHGKVHFCKPPGGVVGFLPVDGDGADAPAVFAHEFF